MSRPVRWLAIAGLLLLAAVGLQLPDQGLKPRLPRSEEQPAEPGKSPATPTPPALASAELNRQDRVNRAHRRRETRAFDLRPLLAVLPLELAGVRVDVVGLAADNRTTILEIAAGPRGRAYAEAVYSRTLSAYGDRGTAYTVRWAR